MSCGFTGKWLLTLQLKENFTVALKFICLAFNKYMTSKANHAMKNYVYTGCVTTTLTTIISGNQGYFY